MAAVSYACTSVAKAIPAGPVTSVAATAKTPINKPPFSLIKSKEWSIPFSISSTASLANCYINSPAS
jgi:hypothetical protein